MTVLPDDNLAYTIAGIGRKSNPYDRRRTFAQRLQAQGMDFSPVDHPLQGAARLAQALVGGYMGGQADRDEKKATEDRNTKMTAAMSEADPTKRIGLISALDPELGIRLSGQMAIDQAKTAQQRESNREAGNVLRGAYGGGASTMPPSTGYQGTLGGYESGNNPTALNPQSGAGGQFQFIPPTWADVRAKNPDLNLPPDPRQAPPELQAEAERRFRASNVQALQAAGIQPTPAVLYLAHRTGAQGAQTLLRADPNAPMDSVVPPQWIAQNPDMQGKTVGQFLQMAQARFPGGGDGSPAAPPVNVRAAPPGQPQPLQINVGGPGGMPQGDNNGMPPQPSPRGVNGPTMMADGSGTAIPPAQPQRAPEIARPQADPAIVNRVSALVASGKMSIADADKAISDDINRRWQFAQTQAAEDRRQQLQIQTEDRRQQGALDRSGAEAFIKGTADRYIKDVRPKAENAINEINNIHQIRQLLDAGAITGTGADARLFTAKLGELLGVPSEQAANTQVLQSALAARVLAGMGGSLGAGFSNADRDFVERAKGGQITMTEPALRRLIDIGERQSRMAINAHDKEVSRLNTIPSLSTMGKEFFTLPPVQDYATWREANPLAPVMPPPAGGAPQGNNSALPPPPPGFRMIR